MKTPTPETNQGLGTIDQFETDYQMEQFREIQGSHFDSEGKKYAGVPIGSGSSEMMLKLINQLEAEVLELRSTESVKPARSLDAKAFLQNKYPSMAGERWNSTNIDDNWVASIMEEFALFVHPLNTWILCDDDMPELNTNGKWTDEEVLGFDGETYMVGSLGRETSGEVFVQDDLMKLSNITHYQPLSPPTDINT